MCIFGKGGHTPSPSKIPPFLEIQDVPTFYRPIRKTKVLNDSFNRFVYKFYPQSILILKEYLLKWYANLTNAFHFSGQFYEKWMSEKGI